jgi:hypothetical protein
MKLELRPEQVLTEHSDLVARYRNPPYHTTRFMMFWMQTLTNEGAGPAAFWPVMHPQDRRNPDMDDALKMCRLLSRELADATTYQVTTEMLTAMREVYTHTMRRVEAINLDELPCDAGWVWLDESWGLIDRRGDTVDIRAVSWQYLEATTSGTPKDPVTPPKLWPCVRFTLWCHMSDDAAKNLFPSLDFAANVRDLGTLTVAHQATIPLGLRFMPTVEQSAADKSADSFLDLIHLLWMFLGMEITTTARPKIQNHYRKHALKSLKHGEVHVVLLRKARHATEPEGAEHRFVDWSCRWPVQGHYRHKHKPDDLHRAIASSHRDEDGNAICAHCNDSLFWVSPYLKGPDGLPLKVSKTLMKLAR